jgi:hypothetical protein
MIVTKLMDHYIKASSLVTDELTNRKVGIHLRQPIFDHGQLYVSFSCVQSSENFKVLVMQFEQPRTFNKQFRICLYR